MRFRPLGNRVVVERKKESQTATGILLVETRKDKPLEGKALAIGEEVDTVKVGEIVQFGKYSGSDIMVDGEEYVLLSLDDVMGVIDPA